MSQQKSTPPIVRGGMDVLALRLRPGADIRRDLTALAQRENIGAGMILGAVGSLSEVRLRFAGQDEPTLLMGRHEILTLSGTIASSGVHLHMNVADSQGVCRGGHVVEGCQVFTTLEVAIAHLMGCQFDRLLDPMTGYPELCVRQKREDVLQD